jgi:hypothetical protein
MAGISSPPRRETTTLRGGRVQQVSTTAFATGYSLPLSHMAAISSQSLYAAQSLEKIPFLATIECRYGTIDLLVLAVCRALATPHCTTYKAFELV